MSLQLHINSSGHWLIDTDLGGVQVGQSYQSKDGSWNVDDLLPLNVLVFG